MKDLKSLPLEKKLFALSCLVILIASSLYAVFNFTSFYTQIKIINYSTGCTEVYINGKLNGSECIKNYGLPISSTPLFFINVTWNITNNSQG